jgi:hypothetical protein
LFVPIIYFFLVETKKRSLEELVRPLYPSDFSIADSYIQDVIFAAGGNPVKKEKSMPYNLSTEEARQILGLAEHSTIVDAKEHDEKASA